MTEPKKEYGIWLCDPQPWERGHSWRIPAFFPLVTSLKPDEHGPWVLPRPSGFSSNRIYPNAGVRDGGAVIHGYHSEEYFESRRYRSSHREKALQMAAKIRAAHPHLLVRVDELNPL